MTTKSLTFAQYIPLALITEALPMTVACNLTGKSEADLDTLSLSGTAKIRLLHASMGCATEAGELLDQLETSKRRVPISAVTKKRGKRRKIDRENIFEEVGDLFWYLAVFRNAYAQAFENCPELPETESWAVPDKFKPRKPGRLFRTVAQRTLSFLDVAKKIIFYNRQTSDNDFLRTYYQVEQSILEVCWSFGIDPWSGALREHRETEVSVRGQVLRCGGESTRPGGGDESPRLHRHRHDGERSVVMTRKMDTEFVATLLGRVDNNHVKVVVVNHHRYSFRVKGKEMGFIDRREAQVHLGGDSYQPPDEATAKALHRQVAVHLGHQLEV